MTNATLSPRLIASIVDDIDSGRPLWGMLRVNEIVPPYHPLHRTLAERASRRLVPNTAPSSIVKKILNGALLQELSMADRVKVHGESPLTEKRRGPFVRVQPYRERCKRVTNHRRTASVTGPNY